MCKTLWLFFVAWHAVRASQCVVSRLQGVKDHLLIDQVDRGSCDKHIDAHTNGAALLVDLLTQDQTPPAFRHTMLYNVTIRDTAITMLEDLISGAVRPPQTFTSEGFSLSVMRTMLHCFDTIRKRHCLFWKLFCKTRHQRVQVDDQCRLMMLLSTD